MAKYNFNAHVRSDKVKWVLVTLALLLVGVIFCGLMTTWFQEWNPFCWFGHDYSEDNVCIRCGSEKPEEEPEAEANSSNVIITPVLEEGIKLFSEPLAVSDNPDTYTLTATLIPVQIEEIPVDWIVEFVDPESTWATGKTVTDYVTVTPTSDGALTATVECLQAFGSQIQVVVAVRDYTTIKATCTVDYKIRPLKVVGNIQSTGNLTFGFSANTFDGSITVFDILGRQNVTVSGGALPSLSYNSARTGFNPTLSVHTIGVETYSYNLSMYLSDSFLNTMSRYNIYEDDMFTHPVTKVKSVPSKYFPANVGVSGNPTHLTFAFDAETCTINDYNYSNSVISFFATLFPGVLQDFMNELNRQYIRTNEMLRWLAAFYADDSISAAEKYVAVMQLDITLDDVTYTFETKLLFNCLAPVTGVSLNQSSIVF